jgi:hypothetical protein
MSLHYESMSNMEIRKVLRTDKDCKIYFRGVFAADTLPKKVCIPCTLVVNTDVAGKPGQHWVAIFITKKRQGFYFDYYDLPPSVPYHIAFIKGIVKVGFLIINCYRVSLHLYVVTMLVCLY